MPRSIQESLYPDSTCFGCGPANAQGLQLRSFVVDDGVVASFVPGPQHTNGMGTLNGGIIATVLDCHSGAAVLQDTSAGAGRLTAMWVTSGLELRYRLPTFLDGPCHLTARIAERADDSMVVTATLSYEDKVRVQAQSRWAKLRQRS